jgi:hypothetical protein
MKLEGPHVVPWTTTIADALETGREWDTEHIVAVLRHAQAKIDALINHVEKLQGVRPQEIDNET